MGRTVCVAFAFCLRWDKTATQTRENAESNKGFTERWGAPSRVIISLNFFIENLLKKNNWIPSYNIDGAITSTRQNVAPPEVFLVS